MFGIKRKSRAALIASFFNAPEHRWAWRQETLRVRLVDLFLKLSDAQLNELIAKRRLLLLYSDARMSCAFHQFRGREVVLVFPDLYRLLLSAEFTQGQAILAHEFGHVLLGHSRGTIDDLQAQLEADAFAASLGFAEELAFALEVYEGQASVPERIAALTGRS